MLTDLSFNNIEFIEGLSCLTKLTDLSLYNNRITKLENLEALKDLHIFSIGNNCIEELDQVNFKLNNSNIKIKFIKAHIQTIVIF